MQKTKDLAEFVELGEKIAKSMLEDKSRKDFATLAHLVDRMSEEEVRATLLWKLFFE